MKIMFLADVHLGAEKRWGVTAEKWDQPFREAIAYAHDNDITLIVLAGDTFEKRNPTTEEWQRFRDALFVYPGFVIDITGNHDVGAALESVSTTKIADTMLNHVLPADTAQMIELNREWPQIVCLPWPRPVDFGIDPKLDLETQIHETRAAVMARLHEICSALDPSRPAVLTGHAMVSYGNSQPDGPGLLLGRDIVLNFDELCNLPGIDSNVLLGHVHDAGAKGYIGSTQPTDFADTAPKTFTVIDFNDGLHRPMFTETIPYETSLRVDEVTLDDSGFYDYEHDEIRPPGLPQVDIRRLKVNTSHDSNISENAVREIFDGMQDRLIVEITRERLERTRIETAIPIAQMNSNAAMAEWLKANEIDRGQAKRVSDLFVGLKEPA